MNQAIELHDSECLAIEVDKEGWGSVLLDAYVHRTSGEPGVSPGEGGVQLIRIKIGAMTTKGNVATLPAYIFEGSLTLGSSIHDNLIPFPTSYTGTVVLNMMLSDDARIIVASGEKISIETEGEFRFVEMVDFTDH